MAGQTTIGVSLRFIADATAAKQQLASLKQDLMGLSSLSSVQFGQNMTKGINDASIAAAKLKSQLDAATNIKTGNLDLTKFSRQLQQSGMSLGQYRAQLASLGPQGQQAFMQLSTSIQNAEIPLIKVNTLFTGLWDTLKRTARWQLSSTAIHAFIGAIQTAYGYAKDLNESLNNIRIVTGQSIDDMAKFAAQANKAAQALSTTTTAYTDAALIYYRQGLSNEDVIDRANVTIKMANVVGKSSEEVSEQLTAVWNNFAKGSEDLELFADKMVALGASTASSSDEIAQGLEKFAAVADTVGLSFDYAAAALTTITATTRQSADTVGTALKTLFSRLESLKLGDTLDDGTDLTKYTEALATVGVNVKNANGELKDMDTILDETMDKWTTLSKDQQVALANTVAGQRQYAQFIALMDNSDFFKQNLETEANASGTLQKQANIYAESWEAAKKRVKAAAESLYSDLINDKFFIELNDNLAKVIGFIDKIIKSMGGLPGLLSTISTLVFSLASDQIVAKLRDIGSTFSNLIHGGKNVTNLKDEGVKQTNLMINSLGEQATPEIKAQALSFSRITELQKIVAENANKITAAELEEYKTLIQIQEAREEENLELQKGLKLAQEKADQAKDEMNFAGAKITTKSMREQLDKEKIKASNKTNSVEAELKAKQDLLAQEKAVAMANGQIKQNGIIEDEGVKTRIVNLQDEVNNLTNKLNECREAENNLNAVDFDAVETKLESYSNQIEKAVEREGELATAATQYKVAEENLNAVLDNKNSTSEQIAAATEARNAAYEQLKTTVEGLGVTYNEEESVMHNVNVAMAEAQTQTANLVSSQAQYAEANHATGEQIQELTNSSNRYINAVRERIQIEQRVIVSANNLNQSFNKIKSTVSQVSTKVRDYAGALVSAARTVSSVAMSFNSLKATIDAFNNPDLSAWEKLSTLMISMPMVLTGFYNVIKGITLGYQNLNTALMANQSLTTGLVGVQKALTAEKINALVASSGLEKAEAKTALTKILEAQATELSISAEGKAAIVKALSTATINKATGALDEETLAKIANIFQTELGIPLTTAEAMAKEFNTGATKKLTASIWSKIGAQMIEHWYIGLIIVVTGILIGIIYSLIKAYDAENEALEKANKNLEQASQRADDATESYNNLKTAIDNLSSAYETFEELERGTAAWAEAVAEVNSQMLDLIDTYPELAAFMTVDSNGIYNLTEKGQDRLNEIYQQKLEAMRTAQIDELVAREAQKIAEINKIATDSSREESHNTWWEKLIRIGQMSNTSYELLRIFSGQKSAIGEQIEADALEQSLNNGLKNLANTLAKDKELTDDQITALLKGGTITKDGNTNFGLDDYISAIGLSADQEKALKNTLQTNATLIQENTSAILDNVRVANNLSDQIGKNLAVNTLTDQYMTKVENFLNNPNDQFEDIQGSGRAEQFISIIGNSIKGNISKVYDAEIKKYQPTMAAQSQWYNPLKWFTTKNTDLTNYINKNRKTSERVDYTSDEKVARAYAAAAGYMTSTEAQSASLKKGKLIANGKTESDGIDIDLDSARAFLWSEEAKKIATKSIGITDVQFDKYLNKISKFTENAEQLGFEFGANFSDALLESLSEGAGEIDLSTIIGEIDTNEYEELSNKTASEIATYFQVDDTIAAQGGFESAQAWGQAFLDELKSNWSPEQYYESQLAKISSKASDMGLDGQEISDYADYISDAAGKLDIFNNALQDNIEDAGKVAIAIGKMDSGLESLAKDLYDSKTKISKAMKENTQGTLEYHKAISVLQQDIGDLLNISKKYISEDFIVDHLEDIEKAADGDAEAIDRLQMLAAKEMIVQVAAELVDSDGNPLEEGMKNKLINAVNTLTDLVPDIQIGTNINFDDNQFNEAAQAILTTAGMTAEKAREIFASMSLDVDFDTKQEPITKTTREQITHVEIRNKKTHLDGTTTYDKVEWTELGKEQKAQDFVEVPLIKFNNGKANINIKHATRTTSGAAASKPSTTSSSSSSSKKKTVDSEIDRYHESEAELNALTKKMNELSTLKDRAWGGRRIAAIRAEQQALKEYGEILQKQVNEAYEYLQQDAAKLNAYGAIYTEDGRIANYNEIIANAINSGMSDEEYDNLKTLLSNYENSLAKYQDSLYAVTENVRNEFDKDLEEMTITVEVKLEVDDRQIEYIEWLVDHLEDKAFSQAAIISTASQNYDNILNKWDNYSDAIHDILKLAGASEQDIQEYLKGNTGTLLELENIDAVKDKLAEYTDGLADTYDQLKDLKDLIEQQLVSVYDEWNDKIEYQMGLMEHYDSILGHYRNIIDILGLDFLGLSTRNLIDISQAQINSSMTQMSTVKAQWKATEEELQTAQTKLANATSEADQKFWTEEVERLTKASNEMEETWYSSWEDLLNKIADLFDLTRERIFKDFEKSISNLFDSFDEMSSLIDQRKTLASEYVPEYKKIYELNKLNRNLTKEIDKLNDTNKIKKLKDLQDEINKKMREGVQLSEYDLEYMQKKYDLRLAEIALEDAQEAKTTVRLQRDSSGNYSYVYTANEEQTNDKVQNYEDKLYALQETTENYFDTLSESYFQTMQDWKNAIASLDENDKNHLQKAKQINEYYKKRMDYISNELNKGLKNNQQLYKNDQEYMNTYYTNQENRQRAFVLEFKNTLVGGILNGFDSIDEATKHITNQMDISLDQLSSAWMDYYNQSEEALQLNGMSFDDFGEKLDEVIFGENGINNKIASIAEETKKMAESSKEDYNKAANAIEDFQKRVGPKLDELFQKTQNYTTAHLTLLDALANKFDDPMNTSTNITITDEMSIDEAKAAGLQKGGGGANQNNNNNNNNNLSTLLTLPQKLINTTNTILDNSKIAYHPYNDEKHLVIIQTGNMRKSYYEAHQIDKTVNSTIKYVKCNLCGQQIKNPNYSWWDSFWYNGLSSIGLKTGGYIGKLKYSNNSTIISGASGFKVPSSRYTGDWGADGRLAILHEKELVLNRQDTNNMLSAVNIIRDLSSTLNLPDLAAKMNYLPNQISSSYFKDLSKNQEIQQEVHIDASFPGVTAREEIEQAFGELALQAAQYVNKYKD